jgi:hypothetical protein
MRERGCAYSSRSLIGSEHSWHRRISIGESKLHAQREQGTSAYQLGQRQFAFRLLPHRGPESDLQMVVSSNTS